MKYLGVILDNKLNCRGVYSDVFPSKHPVTVLSNITDSWAKRPG